MIYAGMALGVGLVILDEIMGAMKWLRLSPLAVGIGIYLPMSATLPVVMGAVIGHIYDNWTKTTPSPEYSKRLAVLIASMPGVMYSTSGTSLALAFSAGGES